MYFDKSPCLIETFHLQILTDYLVKQYIFGYTM